MADRWSQIHKEQLEKVVTKKESMKENFYSFMKSGKMNIMANDKYARGLQVKFDEVCKMSKAPRGVNKEGWLSFLLQAGFTKDVMKTMKLQQIFVYQLKEDY